MKKTIFSILFLGLVCIQSGPAGVAEDSNQRGHCQSKSALGGSLVCLSSLPPWVGAEEVDRCLASDGTENDRLGAALSIDGNTVAIGAFTDDDNGTWSGSAYVFARNAFGDWAEQAKLLPSDGAAGDGFGFALAVTGETVVIGAYGDSDHGYRSGSAYVFARDAFGQWTQQAKLLPLDGTEGDYFGNSVALDGDTAVIGASNDDDNGTWSGSAYVFARDALGQWTQQAKLLPLDGTEGVYFGNSVVLDGDTALIGAWWDDDNGYRSGSTYVFVRDASGEWTQRAKLLSSDGVSGDNFGHSVALDGDTALIGARGDDDNGLGSGSAYVFVRDALGEWTQQAKLLPADGERADMFGGSVAVHGDAVVIGALGDDDNGSLAGAAYVFTRDASGEWTQLAKLLPADGAEADYFGHSIAVDDGTVTIGAYGDDDNGSLAGSAYVFRLIPSGPFDSLPPTIPPVRPR